MAMMLCNLSIEAVATKAWHESYDAGLAEHIKKVNEKIKGLSAQHDVFFVNTDGVSHAGFDFFVTTMQYRKR